MDFSLKAVGATGGSDPPLCSCHHEMSVARVVWLCRTPRSHPDRLPPLGGLWSPSGWGLPSSRVVATVLGLAMSRPGLPLLLRRRGLPPHFLCDHSGLLAKPQATAALEGTLPSSCQGMREASPSLFHLLLFSLGQAWG